MKFTAVRCWLLLLSSLAQSQAPTPTAPEEAATVAPPPVAALVLRAGSLVPLRVAATISSETHVKGASFRLEVTDDIYVDRQLVIPAGSVATGEVIHAAKAGRLGKGGELLVSARYVQIGDRQIRLRSNLGSKGDARDAVAFFNPFIRGRTMVIPAETEVIAKTAVDEAFPAPAATAAH